MKNIRKGIVCLLIFSMALTVSACGEKMPNSPEETIKVISEKANNAEKLDASIDMNMTFESVNNTISMTTKSEWYYLRNPYKIHMKVDMDMGEQGTSGMELYMGAKKDKYYIYQINSGDVWHKQEISKKDFESRGEAYRNQTNLSAYISDPETFKFVETDTKGIAVLEGVVKGESLRKLLQQSGMADHFAGYEIENLDDSVYDSLGDASVKIEVDISKVQIKKLTFDMSGIMEKLMNIVIDSELEGEIEEDDLDHSVKVSECTMTITYNSFKKVKNFDIPKEALDAKESDLGL